MGLTAHHELVVIYLVLDGYKYDIEALNMIKSSVML